MTTAPVAPGYGETVAWHPERPRFRPVRLFISLMVTAGALAIADDVIGEIVLLHIEPPVFFDMRLIAIGGDGDALRREWDLRCRDVAQLQEAREEFSITRGKTDAQSR